MAIQTHIDDAVERVERERTRARDERRAYERFRTEIGSLPVQSTDGRSASVSSAGGAASMSGWSPAASSAGCRRVRELFSETVRPHSVADLDEEEPLLETIREELGESIALVLAPETDAELTPRVQRAIRSTADTRVRERKTLARALDRESQSLDAAADACQSITDWVTEREQTPLRRLGFSELRRRHETLSLHRRACTERLDARQETIQGTTSLDAQTGLEHHSLVEYLYLEFPVRYPVLSTMTRLDSLLADCQRTVRAHLTTRV